MPSARVLRCLIIAVGADAMADARAEGDTLSLIPSDGEMFVRTLGPKNRKNTWLAGHLIRIGCVASARCQVNLSNI